MGHLLSDFATRASTVLVAVGQRTGLSQVLAQGEMTTEFAERTCVAPAYARDWLYAMTAAGDIIVFDPSSARFGLARGFDALLAGPLAGLIKGRPGAPSTWSSMQ